MDLGPGAAVGPSESDIKQGFADSQNPNPLPKLFQPLKIRDQVIKNRLWVSPMCMYSATDGLCTDFHFAHYSQFAIRGASLVMLEATGVLPEGRITPGCLGLWNDEQARGLEHIVKYMRGFGTTVGIQLSHSGRLGSSIPLNMYDRMPTCKSDASMGGWPDQVYAPSAIAFSDKFWKPKELTIDQINTIQQAFVAAAKRADKAGFDVLDIHAAYGFLLNQFLSPLSNQRTDMYGGTFENRTRMLVEVVEKVRKVWPENKPLFVSLSALEGVDGGWCVEDVIELAKLLLPLGVDLSEISVGGNVADGQILSGPNYRREVAHSIKQRVPGLLTGAVGLINDSKQANSVLESGVADCVFSARQFLRNPSFALSAAYDLGVNVAWPGQYECARAKTKYSFF